MLRLNGLGSSKVTIGKLINFMSNDAGRYELFMIVIAQACDLNSHAINITSFKFMTHHIKSFLLSPLLL